MKPVVNLHWHSPTDSTGFYRATGPLTAIKGIDLQVRTEACEFPEMDADLAFVHRPSFQEHLYTIDVYKKYGVPVWIDFDDDFFHVTCDSFAFKNLSHPEVQKNIKTALMLADAVTVTTKALKELYQPYAKCEVQVIPNAMPDWLAKRKQEPSGNKKILWRGNETHKRDLESVEKDVIEIALANPEWSWVFMGGWIRWKIQEAFIKNRIQYEVISNLNILSFFEELLQQAPAVVMVPLDETVFNQAKSNIAWMEATLVGAKAVAPAWPEWDKPGVMQYEQHRPFKDTLLHAIVRSWDTSASWNHITDNLLLSKVNEARINVIQQLTGESL